MTSTVDITPIEMGSMTKVNLRQVHDDHAFLLMEKAYEEALDTHFYALSLFPFYGSQETVPQKIVSEFWPRVATDEKIWDPKVPLKEKTILIHAEGRAEDVVAASRFLYSLIEKSPDKILFFPPLSTIEFFEVIFENHPLIEVISALHRSEFHVHAPLFSIPVILEVDSSRLADLPYLSDSIDEGCSEKSLKGKVSIGLVGSEFPQKWMTRKGVSFCKLSLVNQENQRNKEQRYSHIVAKDAKEMIQYMLRCQELYIDNSFWGCAAGAMGLKSRIVQSKEFPSTLGPAFEQNAPLYPTVLQGE